MRRTFLFFIREGGASKASRGSGAEPQVDDQHLRQQETARLPSASYFQSFIICSKSFGSPRSNLIALPVTGWVKLS